MNKYEITNKYRKTPKGVLTNIYSNCLLIVKYGLM